MTSANIIPKLAVIAAVSAAALWAQDAAACSPNLPNYGNCIRQRNEALIQQQIQAAQQQQQGGYGIRQQNRRPQPRGMNKQEWEDFQRMQQEIAAYKQVNPKGCDAGQDGLQFCWDHTAGSSTWFAYVLAENCGSHYGCTDHGLQYRYDENGRLQIVSIYDRDIIIKGENTYRFNEDGSVTVFDHKRNKTFDQFKKTYDISTEEALNRLHLPKTVLRLKITPDPKQLASFRNILPAGCSGTAEMRVGKVSCSIELLGK
jgi:hypothetical protein